MFGFNKKIEIKKLEINEAYRNYKKNTDKIMIICVDEVVNFDNLHIEGAECLPFRLLKRFDEYYPEKNIIYYIYSLNPALSEKAVIILTKMNYDSYDLGSFYDFHENIDGLNVPRKYRRKK